MRRLCGYFLIILVTALTSYADDDVGEMLADYNVYTIYEIPGQYLDKPINIPMPTYWDGDVGRIRVKAVYSDPHSPTGTAAAFLNQSRAPTTLLAAHDGSPIIRIAVNTEDIDVMYLHFVFKQKKGTVCE